MYAPLMWRPEGRRTVGKFMRRWEYNIKTEWEGVEGMKLAQWTNGELL